MPTLAHVIHAKGDTARFTIEGSSGLRRGACLIVLMTLMRRGSAPLNLPPPERPTFNDPVTKTLSELTAKLSLLAQ